MVNFNLILFLLIFRLYKRFNLNKNNDNYYKRIVTSQILCLNLYSLNCNKRFIFVYLYVSKYI